MNTQLTKSITVKFDMIYKNPGNLLIIASQTAIYH